MAALLWRSKLGTMNCVSLALGDAARTDTEALLLGRLPLPPPAAGLLLRRLPLLLLELELELLAPPFLFLPLLLCSARLTFPLFFFFPTQLIALRLSAESAWPGHTRRRLFAGRPTLLTRCSCVL